MLHAAHRRDSKIHRGAHLHSTNERRGHERGTTPRFLFWATANALLSLILLIFITMINAPLGIISGYYRSKSRVRIADNRSSRFIFLNYARRDVVSVKTSVLIKALSMEVVASRLRDTIFTRPVVLTRYLASQCTRGDEANYAGNVKKDTARPRNMKWAMKSKKRGYSMINIDSRITYRMRLLIFCDYDRYVLLNYCLNLFLALLMCSYQQYIL